ncbi:uncharacterized protein [Hyperolius riggenbachi]|uniref:uncharacterized protein n=1 Tax=Hyperolius riggenbachi TaxID=752182 RepID=UPI0035A3CA49
MTCIRKMDFMKDNHLNAVIQVLVALSAVLLVLFTISTTLKLGQSSDDLTVGGTCLRRPSVKQFLQAIRSQRYSLQALAAFILINCYLLLQINQLSYNCTETPLDNVTELKEWSKPGVNRTEAALTLADEETLTYLAFAGNFLLPLIIYAIQESEPLWQKEKLWGYCYSFILLLSPLKYLSLSLAFYVITVMALKSSYNLFWGVSKWLPALYAISVISLFLFLLAFKMYVEISFTNPVSESAATHFTLRRKIFSYPSPLGVILTTFLIFSCDILYILHFILFILEGRREILIIYLLAFSIAFCLLIVTVSLIVGLRRKCHTNKAKIKQKRVDSGVCQANSFVYQPRSEGGKTDC